MANIQDKLNNIKNALFGRDVRDSIHDGIDAINKEVESTTARQVDLESTFDQLVINSGNSNAEIVDARVQSDGISYQKLGDRLNQFDEKFNTTVLEINELKPKVLSLASGSPKGVYSTLTLLQQAYPSGNSNIYVVSEDGGWYYWNGNTWAKGGTYQSNGIDYNSIDKYMMSQSSFKYNLFDKRLNGFVDNAFLLTDTGEVVNTWDIAKNYAISNYISVSANELLTIQVAPQEVCCFYDSNKEYVCGIKREDVENAYNYTIKVPDNANIKYMRVNIKKSIISLNDIAVVSGSFGQNPNATIIKWLGVDSNNIMNKSIQNRHIEEPITPNNIFGAKPIEQNLFNYNDLSIIDSKFLMSDTGIMGDSSNYAISHFIDVQVNDEFIITTSAQEVCCFYDENKEYVCGIRDLTVVDLVPKIIKVPDNDNIKYMRVNIKKSVVTLSKFMIFTGNKYPSKYYPYGAGTYSFDWLVDVNSTQEVKVLKEVKNFRNKKWLVIGDSITESNFRATKNYHDYIKEWLGLEVINVAASGTGYIHEFQGVKGWLDRLSEFPTDVDFITVMGALNDRHHPVGEFGSNDKNNLYGALKLFYEGMIEKYPNTPIGVITSTPREYSWGKNGEFTPHVDAVVDMAKHYSLPLLDLYRCSGLRPWHIANNKEYFSCAESPEGDGVHPNAKGQLIMAQKIYDFIVQYLLN